MNLTLFRKKANFIGIIIKMGKLNVTMLRYLSPEEFRVLTAVTLLSIYN